ncbi:MAG: adenylate/guanylate cyclase domain-containing protein [Betaproteobacteria bacterium]|nr:MAG: adenylate/guanylate cyclase domain-containing protein [Betaproteobacteria bacterium]
MSEQQVQRRAIVVLYAELRNFTRLSEVLEPGKVLQLANQFFELVARLVAAQRGKVLAVHNDYAFAVLGGAANALKAAQEVQREFAPMGERWKDEYGLPAAVAVGVHLGEAVLGMAGPPGAQQFVAFGDCVSIAERLVHRARAGEIVLSLDMMKALGAAAATLGAQQLPPLDLGQRRPALPIYGILLETRLDFT